MKKELLQELATELAEILRREKKELTRDQLFMRCRDGVSIENVIDAMTELCRIGSVRAHGGAYKFEYVPCFDAEPNAPATGDAKPKAELPSPAIEPGYKGVTGPDNISLQSNTHDVLKSCRLRPVHHNSVDHETIQQGVEIRTDLEQQDAKAPEMVNHPSHYNAGQVEVIDAIEDWQLGFSLGNAIKYIARHQHKGTPLQDLKKAAWYLQREIDRLEKNINK